DRGWSAPFLSHSLIASAIRAAFSNLIPLSNAYTFAAVGVFVRRSSAIAPTISCPRGPYARIEARKATTANTDSIPRRAKFIYVLRQSELQRPIKKMVLPREEPERYSPNR